MTDAVLHVLLHVPQDPAFFQRVAKPFLACKRTHTFVDHWLLGSDLTPHLDMHRFSALNAFERALLCSRQHAATGA